MPDYKVHPPIPLNASPVLVLLNIAKKTDNGFTIQDDTLIEVDITEDEAEAFNMAFPGIVQLVEMEEEDAGPDLTLVD